jgi:hypothetical protein
VTFSSTILRMRLRISAGLPEKLHISLAAFRGRQSTRIHGSFIGVSVQIRVLFFQPSGAPPEMLRLLYT